MHTCTPTFWLYDCNFHHGFWYVSFIYWYRNTRYCKHVALYVGIDVFPITRNILNRNCWTDLKLAWRNAPSTVPVIRALERVNMHQSYGTLPPLLLKLEIEIDKIRLLWHIIILLMDQRLILGVRFGLRAILKLQVIVHAGTVRSVVESRCSEIGGNVERSQSFWTRSRLWWLEISSCSLHCFGTECLLICEFVGDLVLARQDWRQFSNLRLG